MTALAWEDLVPDSIGPKSYRAEVPGGWIYNVAAPLGAGLVFVPFPRGPARASQQPDDLPTNPPPAIIASVTRPPEPSASSLSPFGRSITTSVTLDHVTRATVLDEVRTTEMQTATLEHIAFIGTGRVNIHVAQLDENNPRRGNADPYKRYVGTLTEESTSLARCPVDFVLRGGRRVPSIICVEHIPARPEDACLVTYVYRLMRT